MPIELCVIEGPEAGMTRIFSDNAAVTLGRGPECEFSLRDQSVSRDHCRIKGVDGLFMLRDSSSGNGTQVNGQLAEYVVLKDGDTLAMGLTRVRVQMIG